MAEHKPWTPDALVPPRTHLEDLADELRARVMPDGRVSWPSATWGSSANVGAQGWLGGTVNMPAAEMPSTVTPPPRPGLTAEQAEKLADTLEELVAFLRRRRP